MNYSICGQAFYGNRQVTLPMCDDVFIHCLSFLTQKETARFAGTTRDFNRLKKKITHYRNYNVYNYEMALESQKQHSLKSIVIRNISDSQFHFQKLPEYVFLGHFSSLYPINVFRGMLTGSKSFQTFPHVKTLFVDEAKISIDWGAFPNLEELFISTSQLDLNIDTIWKCTNLRKVIVKIKNSLITVNDRRVTELPKLEVFAVSGHFPSGKYKTVSENIKTFIFYSKPEYVNNNIYLTNSRNYAPDDSQLFRCLFKQHHKIPITIKSDNKYK